MIRRGSYAPWKAPGLSNLGNPTYTLISAVCPGCVAASTLITAVSRDLRTLDDASIVVVDMLASESTSFPTVALQVSKGQGGETQSAYPMTTRPHAATHGELRIDLWIKLRVGQGAEWKGEWADEESRGWAEGSRWRDEMTRLLDSAVASH